jgi:hypothetical protein
VTGSSKRYPDDVLIAILFEQAAYRDLTPVLESNFDRAFRGLMRAEHREAVREPDEALVEGSEGRYWNHRVMRQVWQATGETGAQYAIHEVFYEVDGTVRNWTHYPVDAHGEDLDDLREYLELMGMALEHPVLDYETGAEVPQEARPGVPTSLPASLQTLASDD